MFAKRVCITSVRGFLTGVRYSTQVEIESKKENDCKHLPLEHDADTNPAGWDEAQPYENMPGPKPLPIIGNMWRFLPGGEYHNLKVDKLLKTLPAQYGKIIRFRGIIGRKDLVFILDPDDMESILRNVEPFPKRLTMNAVYYYRNVLRKDVYQGMDGLIWMHDEEWYKMRTIVNPILLQPRVIQQYTTQMDNIAKDFVNCTRRHLTGKEKNETSDNFAVDVHKWALESIAVVALNKRLGELYEYTDENSEVHRFAKAILKLTEQLYYLEILPPYWKFLPSKKLNDFIENMDFVASVIIKLIDEGLEDSGYENMPESQRSVLQQLAKINKKVAFTMTFDMLLAGLDTTGKVMGAALYFLSKNPDKQNKLREEILKFLPEKRSALTTEALYNMPYLKAVVKEAARIAPASLGTLRTTTKNMVAGGYRIPTGTNLLLSHFYSSNLTADHFKEPEKFMPERWLRSTNDEYSIRNVHSFASMPFGFGTRSCIGKRLANLELEVGIANMIRNFDLSWQQPDLEFGAKVLYGFVGPLKFTVKELD